MPQSDLLTKPSEPGEVNAYLKKLKHPLKDACGLLRDILLASDRSVGEEIYWNAPCFFFTGKLKPFKPKEYKRVIAVFNLYKKDCLRLIFLRGALAKDKSGLLQGDYKDGRRLALFHSTEDVQKNKKTLQKIMKALVSEIKKTG